MSQEKVFPNVRAWLNYYQRRGYNKLAAVDPRQGYLLHINAHGYLVSQATYRLSILIPSVRTLHIPTPAHSRFNEFSFRFLGGEVYPIERAEYFINNDLITASVRPATFEIVLEFKKTQPQDPFERATYALTDFYGAFYQPIIYTSDHTNQHRKTSY